MYLQGYKNIMTNCMDNTNVLRRGLVETGRFEIVSKEMGVPLVAFSLKDASKYNVFEISDALRRFGWIIPAYTMPADAQDVAVLRVVVREDFSRSLAERLVSDIEKVVREMDAVVQRRETTIAAHVTASVEETGPGEKMNKKTVTESHEEIAMYWKRLVDRKKTSGVC